MESLAEEHERIRSRLESMRRKDDGASSASTETESESKDSKDLRRNNSKVMGAMKQVVRTVLESKNDEDEDEDEGRVVTRSNCYRVIRTFALAKVEVKRLELELKITKDKLLQHEQAKELGLSSSSSSSSSPSSSFDESSSSDADAEELRRSITNLRETHKEEKEKLKAKLDSSEQTYARRIAELVEFHREERMVLKAKLDAVEELHLKRISELNAVNEEKASQTKLLDTLHDAHRRQIADLQDNHSQEQKGLQEKLKGVEESHLKSIADLELIHNEQQMALADKLEAVEVEYRKRIADLQQTHKQEQKSMTDQLNAVELKNLKRIVELERAHKQIQDRMKTKLRAKNEQLSRQGCGLKRMSTEIKTLTERVCYLQEQRAAFENEIGALQSALKQQELVASEQARKTTNYYEDKLRAAVMKSMAALQQEEQDDETATATTTTTTTTVATEVDGLSLNVRKLQGEKAAYEEDIRVLKMKSKETEQEPAVATTALGISGTVAELYQSKLDEIKLKDIRIRELECQVESLTLQHRRPSGDSGTSWGGDSSMRFGSPFTSPEHQRRMVSLLSSKDDSDSFNEDCMSCMSLPSVTEASTMNDSMMSSSLSFNNSLPSLPLLTPVSNRGKSAPHCSEAKPAPSSSANLLWTILCGVLLFFSCATLDGGKYPIISLWNPLSSFVQHANHAATKDIKPRFLPSFVQENDTVPKGSKPRFLMPFAKDNDVETPKDSMLMLPGPLLYFPMVESVFVAARANGSPLEAKSEALALRLPPRANPIKVLMSQTASRAAIILAHTTRIVRQVGAACRKALRRMCPAMLFGALGGFILQPSTLQQMGAVSQAAVGGVRLLAAPAWYLPLILIGIALLVGDSAEPRQQQPVDANKTSLRSPYELFSIWSNVGVFNDPMF